MVGALDAFPRPEVRVVLGAFVVLDERVVACSPSHADPGRAVDDPVAAQHAVRGVAHIDPGAPALAAEVAAKVFVMSKLIGGGQPLAPEQVREVDQLEAEDYRRELLKGWRQ